MADPLQKLRPRTKAKINRVALSLVEGKSGANALKEGGFAPTNRRRLAQARRTLSEILDNVGLTDAELANRLDGATKAMAPLSFRGRLTGDEVPDNKARVKALDLVCEVKGHKPGRELKVQAGLAIPIQVIFGGGHPEKMD